MPYIKSDDDRREALQKGDTARSAGELNYQIFYYVKHYDWRKSNLFYYNYYHDIERDIRQFIVKFLGENPNYQKYNDMTGCLIRCYKEIYRRLHIDLEDVFIKLIKEWDFTIAGYEDIKIRENGDVE